MGNAISAFEGHAYLNLETFKRDGKGVKTPVWFAKVDDKLVVFTDGTSYKVKRLRRDTHVRVAPCDVRGVLRGDWFEGRGELVEDAAFERRIYDALLAKYGWQLRLLNIVSTLGRRVGRRKTIAVVLSNEH